MNIYLQRLILGAGINLLLALGAFRKRAVTISGGVTGFILGTIIYLGGGLYFWLHLGAFFFSSTLLGRIRTDAKLAGTGIHAKDGRRDGLQVFSNVGPAAAAALLYALTSHPVFLVAFAASFAAANADTWAGEIGMLAESTPVSILNGRPLTLGASGAVTPLGFWASFFGALFITLFFSLGYLLTAGFTYRLFLWAAIVTICGFLGSVIDSLLGATVQAGYSCAVTRQHTERPFTDGRPNTLVKGVAFINNDTVNLLSVSAVTVTAALVSLAV